MKSKKEIREWLENHSIENQTERFAIKGFIHSQGYNTGFIKPVAYTLNKDKVTFSDFKRWFEGVGEVKYIPKTEFKAKKSEMPWYHVLATAPLVQAKVFAQFNPITEQYKNNNTMKNKTLTVDIETARRWYSTGSELKELALSLFKKEELSGEEKKQPKFKVGDWVRYKSICGDIVEINLETDRIVYCIDIGKGCKVYAFEYELKPYYPKEGEFCACETYSRTTHIINCKNITDDRIRGSYNLSIISRFPPCYKDGYILNRDISIFRPATEQEKKQLIKAVEAEYKKTWNGKEWVDIYHKFKKGDYLYNAHYNAVFIFEKYYDLSISAIAYHQIGECAEWFDIYAQRFININETIRLATPDEIKRLNNALEKAGKRFNKETLELEDILKVGDLVIAWGNDPKKAVICELLEIDNSTTMPHRTYAYGWSSKVIKWDGTKEQYEGILKGGSK